MNSTATIQEAIDGAVDGDAIELTDGTFTGSGNYNIVYHGKEIAVRSQSGDPDATLDNLSAVDLDSAGASATGGHTGKAAGGYYKGMAVFTFAKGGLMYEAAIGGQKFSYKPKK